MDALESERFSRSPSLQWLSDSEDKYTDKELGEAIEEDYCSPDLNKKEIISSGVNKDNEDEIEQLTDIFRSCVREIINGETGVLQDGTPCVEKGPKLHILMTVVHQHSSKSSNSYSHHSSGEGIKKTVVQHSSNSSNNSNQRSSCKGRKSLPSDPTISPFKSCEKVDSSKKTETPQTETPQNDVGLSKLPLPPRLREATYRNPLRLGSPHRDSIDLPPPKSLDEIFSPKGSSGRNSVQSSLSKMVKTPKSFCKMVKKPKEISVKLWKGGLNLIRDCGKLEFKGIQAGVRLLMETPTAAQRNGYNEYNLYHLN